MKSKRVAEYINTHRKILCTAQDGVVSDTLNTIEAIEAVRIVEKERDAIFHKVLDIVVARLEKIHSMMVEDDRFFAQIETYELLTELKNRDEK